MGLIVNGKPFDPYHHHSRKRLGHRHTPISRLALFRNAYASVRFRILTHREYISKYSLLLVVSLFIFSLSALYLNSTSYRDHSNESSISIRLPHIIVPPPPHRVPVQLPIFASHDILNHTRQRRRPGKDTLLSRPPKSPTSPLSAATPRKAAAPSINNNNSTSTENRRNCKWEQYGNWPYVSEYPHFLSPHRRKLLYLKTPKSSSSTTAHILQRYTNRSGLLVGYPDFAANEWTFQTRDSLRAALKRSGKSELDALVSHLVYEKAWVDEVLNTKNNNISRPFRVTSVRDPVSRSWSMYTHGKSDIHGREFLMGTHTPMEFARVLEKDSQLQYVSGTGGGVRNNTPENVSEHYDHIVVSERVLESMVTLAPKLGMHASDLLYVSQKLYGYAKKIPSEVSKQEKKFIDNIIRAKSYGDTRLHILANERIDKELKALPRKIFRIVKDVPQMMKEVHRACGDIGPENNSCRTKEEASSVIVWDGNQMCLARCIERWAQRNMRCA